MTAPTLDLAPAPYAVDGLSALVPGTSLRLPVLPGVRHLPADQRCDGCAGTGVDFVAVFGVTEDADDRDIRGADERV